MADKLPTLTLLFNGNPITQAEARALIVGTYTERRLAEILEGLATGLYGCASVAGGHLELPKGTKLVKAEPDQPKPGPVPGRHR